MKSRSKKGRAARLWDGNTSDAKPGSGNILDRAIDILYLLADLRRPLAVDEIARQLALPKSTVYRIVRALRSRELVHPVTEQKGYSLGLVFLHWAEVVQGGLHLVQLTGPVLRELAQKVGETAIFTFFDGRHAVTIDSVVNAEALRMAPPLGVANPLHCSATSKAILAWLPEERWKDLVGPEPFHAYTSVTIRNFAKLRADLKAARRRGYAISDGEVYEGARGVAAPVFADRGLVCGSLAIAGPRQRLGDDRLPAIGALLRTRAATLSAALGFREVVERNDGNR